MKSIIAILLAIVITTSGTGAYITEDNLSNYLSPDYNTVSTFILDNITLFADEYNKQLVDGEERFEATSCEFSAPVLVETYNQEGIYLDFNGNNGYMIVVDNYTVIDFQTKGDLDYLKESDYLYYSIYDGFLYIDTDGNYVPYYYKEMTEEDWGEYQKVSLESYAGQTSGNDGEIYNPTNFVKSKYGKGYEIYKQVSLPNYTYVSQYDLSIYYETKGNSTYSEGNCSLASIYSLMNYLKTQKKYNRLPSSSSTTSYDAKNDSFYEKYNKKTNYNIDNPKTLPKLYLSIRNYAVNNYGYEVSGTNPFNIATIIERVGLQYGCDIDANHILIWSYEKQVVNEINAGYPTIWNMANSSTYGSHTTVVTGYKTYRKTTKILGINCYSYVNLLQLNDNWNKSARYFDFTDYNAFGSFVKVR